MPAHSAILDILDCALEFLEIAKLCGNPTDRDQWLDRARSWARFAGGSEANGDVGSPDLEELLSELDGDWMPAAGEL